MSLAPRLQLLESMVDQVQLLCFHGDTQVEMPHSQHVVRESVTSHQVGFPWQHWVCLFGVQDELCKKQKNDANLTLNTT